MMSLDVVSMFTRVRTDETLIVVWYKLTANPLTGRMHLYSKIKPNGDIDFLCGNDLLCYGV